MSNRKFYRTEIKVVVSFKYDNLHDVALAITTGDCSGEYKTANSTILTGKQIAEALKAQGSDPGFFQLDDQGEDLK
jgi:hypothetical protein